MTKTDYKIRLMKAGTTGLLLVLIQLPLSIFIYWERPVFSANFMALRYIYEYLFAQFPWGIWLHDWAYKFYDLIFTNFGEACANYIPIVFASANWFFNGFMANVIASHWIVIRKNRCKCHVTIFLIWIFFYYSLLFAFTAVAFSIGDSSQQPDNSFLLGAMTILGLFFDALLWPHELFKTAFVISDRGLSSILFYYILGVAIIKLIKIQRYKSLNA